MPSDPTGATADHLSPPAPGPLDETGPGWLGPASILALGTFAMGTDSFVLAGILPQLSSGLQVTDGAAGQVVTAFALTYAVAAPLLATLAARLARKALMIGALAVFLVANLAGAAAPDLAVLLVARVAAALGAALFTPTASAAAVALAGPARRGRALSVILGGLALGTVLGVPVGTVLGQHLGWQASLVFIAGVALVAAALMLAVLPALPLPPAVSVRTRLAVLVDRRILAVIGVGTLATGSGFLVYTYIARVLAARAHVSGAGLSVALLAWGVGAGIGAFASGWCSDRIGPDRTIVVSVALMGLVLLGLGFAGGLAAVLPLMVLGGAGSWGVNTPLNHRLTGMVAPAAAGVVISCNSSGTYLGQALGAGVGGALLAGPATRLCVVGATGAAAALAVHLVSTRRAART